MPRDPASDRASLIGLCRGDAEALNGLIARWQGPLLGFAARYAQNAADAQDLVAETFVQLYRHRSRLAPDTNLSAWLFTTLANRCHNHHRWKLRHPALALESGDLAGEHEPSSPAAEGDPGAVVARDEAREAVRLAIDALPHELKVPLLLYHYERLTYREIASVTDCSERLVESRLLRAREQLRRNLGPYLREVSRG